MILIANTLEKLSLDEKKRILDIINRYHLSFGTKLADALTKTLVEHKNSCKYRDYNRKKKECPDTFFQMRYEHNQSYELGDFIDCHITYLNEEFIIGIVPGKDTARDHHVQLEVDFKDEELIRNDLLGRYCVPDLYIPNLFEDWDKREMYFVTSNKTDVTLRKYIIKKMYDVNCLILNSIKETEPSFSFNPLFYYNIEFKDILDTLKFDCSNAIQFLDENYYTPMDFEIPF